MVRHKNRYITVEIKQVGKSDDELLKIKENCLYKAIIDKIQTLHGDFGVAAIKSGFSAKYCNERTRISIIRVRHGPHRLVASSLPFISAIENKNVIIRTLYTGATMKQCFKFLLVYQQKIYDKYCSSLKTDEEKIALKEEIMKYSKSFELNRL